MVEEEGVAGFILPGAAAAAFLPPPLPPPPRLDLRVPPNSQFFTASFPATAEPSDAPVPTASEARGAAESLASSSSSPSPPRDCSSSCVKLFLPILLDDSTRVSICVGVAGWRWRCVRHKWRRRWATLPHVHLYSYLIIYPSFVFWI